MAEHSNSIEPGSVVDEVVERHPAVAWVFVRRRMHCLGCDVAPFHTIADAAREYDLPLDDLLEELNGAATVPIDPPPAVEEPDVAGDDPASDILVDTAERPPGGAPDLVEDGADDNQEHDKGETGC